jgi:hypothetical protein
MKNWLQHFLALIFIFCSLQLDAVFNLPRQLSDGDTKRLVEILGAQTGVKPIFHPFALGGYSGVDIGITVERVASDELRQLGDGTTSITDLVYTKLEVAKGLQHGVDLFFQIAPYNRSVDLSSYGGGIKWTFFESKNVPANLSAILVGHDSNIKDLVILKSYSLEWAWAAMR